MREEMQAKNRLSLIKMLGRLVQHGILKTIELYREREQEGWMHSELNMKSNRLVEKQQMEIK